RGDADVGAAPDRRSGNVSAGRHVSFHLLRRSECVGPTLRAVCQVDLALERRWSAAMPPYVVRARATPLRAWWTPRWGWCQTAATLRATGAVAIALAAGCASTASRLGPSDASPSPEATVAIDAPVPVDTIAPVDVSPPVDTSVAIDTPVPVDMPAADTVLPSDCAWTVGAPVDPVLSFAASPRIVDAVPYRDGAVMLVLSPRSDRSFDADLLFVDRGGNRVGGAVRLEGPPIQPSEAGSLAVSASGDVAALCGSTVATLHLWSAAGRPLRRVALMMAASQAHAIRPSATGWSFLRIFDAAPRVHEVELDLDGVARGDTVLPMPLPTEVNTPFGPLTPLRAVRRAALPDGRMLTATSEFLGQGIAAPPGSRFTVMISRGGDAAPPAVATFEGFGLDSFALVPRPGGALLAATATSYARVPLGSGTMATTYFSTRTLSERATPGPQTNPWPVSPIATTNPTAVTDTLRGPVAVLPIGAPGDANLRRFEMFEIAADGMPGRNYTIPAPAGLPGVSSLVAVGVRGGALALVGAPDRVLAIPLRCE
ncbi:MAG: hypothetical protein U0325_32765, partial [Polyangiales bacterium]